MIKIISWFCFIYLVPCLMLHAKDKLSDNLFLGGSIGLQFSDITFIEVAPLVGYHLTPRLSTGLGAKYQYYKENTSLSNFKTSVYGGKIFSSYILIQEIPFEISGKLFAHSEYEILSLEKKYFKSPYNEDGRFLMHSILVGGGYKQLLGSRAAFSLMVLWNLNEYKFSPYSNPIIRFGFSFNL